MEIISKIKNIVLTFFSGAGLISRKFSHWFRNSKIPYKTTNFRYSTLQSRIFNHYNILFISYLICYNDYMDEITENNPVLSLNKYIIDRGILKPSMTIKNENGEVILKEVRGLFNAMKIENENKQVFFTLSEEIMLHLMPTFDVHLGEKKGPLLGKVKFTFNLNSLLTGTEQVLLLDANNQTLGKATGDFYNYLFQIVDMQGTTVASMKKYVAGNLGTEISQAAKNTYELEIFSTDTIKIYMILGFVVAIEEGVRRSNVTAGFVGGPMGPNPNFMQQGRTNFGEPQHPQGFHGGRI